MPMSRKDYVALARVLRYHHDRSLPGSTYREVTEDIAEDLATAMYSANSSFDRAKFLTACGVE